MLVAVLMLGGCGSAGPPLLQGSIKADPATNPDARGRASPVVVRVYELRSPAAFGAADFFSLFDSESQALGGDLVGREEYQLRPAETLPYRRQLQPDTRFIGVVAAFRDLENSRWRQVTAVPAKGESTIAIGIEVRAVTVTIATGGSSLFKKEALPKEALPTPPGSVPSSPGSLPSAAGSSARDSLLKQVTDVAAELTSMSTGRTLTPEQSKQVTDLLSKANSLRGQLQNPDPSKIPQLSSNLLDLQEQLGALKARLE
jgi:type VI secretion system protein VasD